MLQIAIVILLFLSAALWLGKKAYNRLKGGSQAGCEHCVGNQVSKKANYL